MADKINPRCKSDMAQIYISADGYVYPCCWMGNVPHTSDYRDFYNSELDKLNVNLRSLKVIIEDRILEKVEATWQTDNPHPTCMRFCKRKAKPDETNSEDKQGTNTVKRISRSEVSSN
ncbi:MAG: SPASM domain-containing protein [Bdellovibrionales bacterium]|nr:SPASM domain-containing protein [Bdellovibrionales bacterium]